MIVKELRTPLDVSPHPILRGEGGPRARSGGKKRSEEIIDVLRWRIVDEY
jgi:hypothetical protein